MRVHTRMGHRPKFFLQYEVGSVLLRSSPATIWNVKSWHHNYVRWTHNAQWHKRVSLVANGVCVRARACVCVTPLLHLRQVACLWCRPWVTPNQFINLSAVTRPRPTSKRTAPLLHFSSLRSEGRNACWWHSIDFNKLSFHLISVQQFRLTTFFH